MEDVISRPAREALGDTTRRCTATSKTTGQRCGRAPIPGGFVCVMHGGKVPAVRASARERLLAMVDPALDALLRFLRQAPPCPHCGRSDADRDPTVLRAAQLVLDRTGFHPTLTVQQVQAPTLPDYFAWIPPARLAHMGRWIAEARAAKERGEPTAAETALAALPGVDVVDAVLVDEPLTPGGQGYAPVGAEPNAS